MMEELTIQPATLNDAELLATLVNSAYRGETSKKGWTTEADLLDGERTNTDTMRGLLERDDSVILKVLHPEKGLIASVHLQRESDHVYLGMLTVSPVLQGAGVGKMLLKAAEAHAIEMGLPVIRMTVITVREELIAWYERHGYFRTGDTKPFPAADPRFGIPRQFLEFAVLEKKLSD